MELSFNVVVILIICIIVAAVGIIFGMGILIEGQEGTEDFWDIEQCIPRGGRCTYSRLDGTDDCCNGLICRWESSERASFCLEIGRASQSCKRELECESNLDCVNNICCIPVGGRGCARNEDCCGSYRCDTISSECI